MSLIRILLFVGFVLFITCNPSVAINLNLAGEYTCQNNCPAGGEGAISRIEQDGMGLFFINEGGNRSSGIFLNSSTVVAKDWGNLHATVRKNGLELHWANGTVWQRANGGNNSSSIKCDNYLSIIHNTQEQIRKAHHEYSQLVHEMDNFDKKTRVTFCIKDVDHFSQVGILEFDDSWNSWLSGINSKLSYLGKIPALGAIVGKISDGISFFIQGLSEWESERLPIDEAWAEYREILTMRKQVIENLHNAIKQYYCREIFDHDARLYDLYHHEIPDNKTCNEFEKKMLIERITRNRPVGLPPIWVESNYKAALDSCK